ncbi:hypothetical protein EGW08_019150, partial [Elysia chlorotica]
KEVKIIEVLVFWIRSDSQSVTLSPPTRLAALRSHLSAIRKINTRPSTMPGVQELVDSKIAGKKVMVFSKSHCPFCTKAKKVFQKYLSEKILSDGDYEVMELDNSSDMSSIQDYLLKKTGGRSVPRVFINGKFIGGGDDVVAKDKSGELKKML